jgi:nitroimidazol reductase NimA-like FMN-containing flavoprotein (pyridoxamine 5'-phosphate oxidase superfamily)
MLGKLNSDQIDQLLAANVTGRIGCTDGSRVYIVPVSYVFNGTYLIAHSREGMKIDMMRTNSQVCFQVDEIDDYANWRSVILWGEYEEVTDPKERYYAMKFLVSHLMHVKVSETAGVREMHEEIEDPGEHDELLRPVVYRIRINEKTGRFEKN